MHDYKTLARHFIPLGEQKNLNTQEVMGMLEERTRKFTKDEIARHWPVKKAQ